MSDKELDELEARKPGYRTVRNERDWVLIKNGYYYRPEAKGYTTSLLEAGAYEEAYARQYADESHGHANPVVAARAFDRITGFEREMLQWQGRAEAAEQQLAELRKEKAELEGALRNLVAAGDELQRYGAQTGSQWVRHTTALVRARTALKGKGTE